MNKPETTLSRDTQILVTTALKEVLEEISRSIRQCGELASSGKLDLGADQYFRDQIGNYKNTREEIYALIKQVNT